MKLKSIISFSLLLAMCNTSNAQQVFTISQFIQHNFIFNPAAAGANDDASVGATYRKMWAGIDGGPQTTILYGDKYFSKKKVGVAVVLYDDKTGPTSRSGGQVNLSYSIEMQQGRKLMFGLAGTLMQYKLDKAVLAAYIPNDPLLSASENTIKGDAAAGIYYKSPTLSIGASVQQLVQSKFNYIKTNNNPQGKLYRHYYFMGSYNWKVDEVNVVVPNVLVEYLPNAPVYYTAGVRLEHNDIFWVGLSYHHQQGYSAFVGLKIDHKLALGYSYDQYTTPLSLFDDGSGAHELSIRYYFKK
jgi:type IX secretion system PorP/SprF family membrane protein